jgi:hypothetical protein
MFELDKDSQDLHTIITPFGKYKYLRLLMRLKCSPDIAQAAMENLLSEPTFTSMMLVLSPMIGTTMSICKLLFYGDYMKMALPLTDLSVNGPSRKLVKPWKKKIDTMLRMDHPCNATELGMFIGCVNYYCDKWPSRAHILKTIDRSIQFVKESSYYMDR